MKLGRAPHPRRDEAVNYAIDNPHVSYAETAKLYGVNANSLAVWLNRRRKAVGTLAVPPRSTAHKPKPITPNLVSLPAPPPRQATPEIQEEFRAAALNAAKRVHELSKDPKLSLRDATHILELTTGTFELLAPMSGTNTSKAPGRLVDALLGTAPPDGLVEEEDAMDALTGLS
jgi:hypothetical protein